MGGARLAHLYDSAHYLGMEENRAELSGGAGSVEDLVDSIFVALAQNDTAMLHRMTISVVEWNEIVYPELGLHYPDARDSRPTITQMMTDLHFGSARKGMMRALRDFGGSPLDHAPPVITDTLRYPSYLMLEGVALDATTDDGRTIPVTFLGSIVLKQNVAKLLAFRESSRTEE